MMESGEEIEYVQMSSPVCLKTFTWEEILDKSVHELHKILEDRGQDTKGLGKPQLQRKLMSEILGKQKAPLSSLSISRKEAVMRGKSLELKWSCEEEIRQEEQVMEYELHKLTLQLEAEERRERREGDERREEGAETSRRKKRKTRRRKKNTERERERERSKRSGRKERRKKDEDVSRRTRKKNKN